MKKLKLKTPDLTDANIERIAKLFPNVTTEKEGDDGKIVKAIDFDLLRQELSKEIVDDDTERYRLDWPGKKASLLKANTPITKTLRPVREDSVNFDTTENVYIEGDNFEVLKILQESYLGKVKMIYIDPPYNTGTAMIYNNDFVQSDTEFNEKIGSLDEEGIKMFKNTDTNGRFHSAWLSMMYERIIIARDLLTIDGFIAIAIDHNELHSLIAICDEVFGEENRIGVVTVVHKPEGRNQEKFFGTSNEYMLVYAKNKDTANFNNVVLDENLAMKFTDSDRRGKFRLKNYIRLSDGKYSLRINKPHFYYPVFVSSDLSKISLKNVAGYTSLFPITDAGQERTWKTTPATLIERFNNGDLVVRKTTDGSLQLFEKLREDQVIKTHWVDKKYHGYHFGTKIIDELLGDKTFDFPKSLFLMIDILKIMIRNDDIILDFFSGSATTAHAVIQLNAEDGGNRKFIMVQLPEKTDEKSEAYKAGYKTISEIGKERIRRAGKKIKEDELKIINDELEKLSGQMLEDEKKKELETKKKQIESLDIGFRVYKTDTSNMKDVYYHPSKLDQSKLDGLISNVKEERTPEDLLTQVILDLGLELSLPVESKDLKGNTVYFVQQNALIACFDDNIDFGIVDEIAKAEPLKVVFKDSSFKDDKDRINVENRFKRLSPETQITVI
jgi:adenine-specific DNA-methyltransferase